MEAKEEEEEEDIQLKIKAATCSKDIQLKAKATQDRVILHKDLPRRTHHREHILQEVEDTMRHQMERVATRADQEQVVISRQGEVDQVLVDTREDQVLVDTREGQQLVGTRVDQEQVDIRVDQAPVDTREDQAQVDTSKREEVDQELADTREDQAQVATRVDQAQVATSQVLVPVVIHQAQSTKDLLGSITVTVELEQHWIFPVFKHMLMTQAITAPIRIAVIRHPRMISMLHHQQCHQLQLMRLDFIPIYLIENHFNR
ncbi:uncharacterized protein LOC120349765 [Nilaparvata lugens]|uniref:uncharacterized protein LOC120349765 n=1 Tax=Nilaparvata lugens TaxID=108931 RepID=UPI00193CD691|nr:uncharacterized protein LOC120349765 [Nilaparvata lugens]